MRRTGYQSGERLSERGVAAEAGERLLLQLARPLGAYVEVPPDFGETGFFAVREAESHHQKVSEAIRQMVEGDMQVPCLLGACRALARIRGVWVRKRQNPGTAVSGRRVERLNVSCQKEGGSQVLDAHAQFPGIVLGRVGRAFFPGATCVAAPLFLVRVHLISMPAEFKAAQGNANRPGLLRKRTADCLADPSSGVGVETPARFRLEAPGRT